MQITAIEPRRKGLSALYIDGEFAINIDSEVLLSDHIDIGNSIDDETLHELIHKSDVKRCKNKALYLIEFRDHTKKELIDKLKKTFPENIVLDTADHLEELGLINDESYAKRYTNDLINLKKLSRRGVKQKLYEKGIDKYLIEDILEDIDINEKEQIRKLIESKYYKIISDEKGYNRAFNALVRKGYDYNDIKSVMRDYTEENYG